MFLDFLAELYDLENFRKVFPIVWVCDIADCSNNEFFDYFRFIGTLEQNSEL